jgi:hypothetical protein
MRRAAFLATVAVAVLAGGCGTAASGTRSVTPATPAAAIGDQPTSPPPRPTRRVDHAPRTSRRPSVAVASAFAAAYGRYLDGRLPARALPGASSAARADVGPVITPAERAGQVVVQSTRRAPGTAVFTARLRDRAHTFTAHLTLGQTSGRWLVIAVTAPDLDSILNAHSTPISQPSGSAPPERAARAFLAGYLPWLYGAGRAGAIHDGARALTAQLRANPPRIPPAFQGLHPRLASIGMQRHGHGWRAFALVTDGRETYDLVMEVEQPNGRWVVSSIGLPG